MTSPLGLPLCYAGRVAFFGGAWMVPCLHIGRNNVGTELARDAVFLCDEHFEQVNDAGLIDEPYLSPEQFDDKYR